MIGVEGTLDAVEVEVSVALRITRSDLPLGSNSFDVPLYLWDSATQAYADVYGLNGPPAGLPLGSLLAQSVTETEDSIDFKATDRKSVHLDVYLPGGLAHEMINILNGLPQTAGDGWVPPPDLSEEIVYALIQFFVGATIDHVGFEFVAELKAADGSFVDDDLSDNFASRALVLLLPGEDSYYPDNPLAFEDGAEGGWENPNFGVGFEFNAFASVDEAGAIAAGEGAIPVTLLGNTLNLVEFNARAQVVPAIDPESIPDGENSGFYLNLDFAGLTVYSLEEDLGFLYEDELSFSKGKNFNNVFFVGPVPVTVGAGIEGSIGFELHANLQPVSLATSAGPFAQLEANVTGAIGVPGLQAGVGGALTILDERFTGTVLTGLVVVDPGPQSAVFEGSASLKIVNTLTGPVGRLFLFADYPAIVWCNSVFGVFPCGVKVVRSELVLVEWASFVKEDVLFDESLCKAVTIANGNVTFSSCD